MNAIQLFTFVLVFSMTIGQAPIQKAIDAVSKKYERQALIKLCARIGQMQDVYANNMGEAVAEGCRIAVFDRMMKKAKNKEQEEEIVKLFKEHDSLEFTKINDYCSSRAADWRRATEAPEVIATDLYEHFQCKTLSKKEVENEESK